MPKPKHLELALVTTFVFCTLILISKFSWCVIFLFDSQEDHNLVRLVANIANHGLISLDWFQSRHGATKQQMLILEFLCTAHGNHYSFCGSCLLHVIVLLFFFFQKLLNGYLLNFSPFLKFSYIYLFQRNFFLVHTF